MVQIIYEKFDVFTYREGAGIVIADKLAVLFITQRRPEEQIIKAALPVDTIPAKLGDLNKEIQAAFRGVMVALSETVDIPVQGGKVCLTDYISYDPGQGLSFLDKESFLVSASLLPTLKKLRMYGIRLAYDNSKSQGIDIRSSTNNYLGNVRVFMNPNWLSDLIAELVTIAAIFSG